jgi:hypothetical protein
MRMKSFVEGKEVKDEDEKYCKRKRDNDEVGRSGGKLSP